MVVVGVRWRPRKKKKCWNPRSKTMKVPSTWTNRWCLCCVVLCCGWFEECDTRPSRHHKSDYNLNPWICFRLLSHGQWGFLVLLPPFTSPPTCSPNLAKSSLWVITSPPTWQNWEETQTNKQTNKQKTLIQMPPLWQVATWYSFVKRLRLISSELDSVFFTCSVCKSGSKISVHSVLSKVEMIRVSFLSFFLSFFYVATVHMVQFLVKWKKERKKEREREREREREELMKPS